MKDPKLTWKNSTSKQPSKSTCSAVYAGTAYFSTVFVIGFALGVVRTAAINPDSEAQRLVAVAIELPVILTASWLVCRRILKLFQVPADRRIRLMMGVVAFGLLIVAELVFDVVLGGRTVVKHFAQYENPSHILGLIGQISFALFPLWQTRAH